MVGVGSLLSGTDGHALPRVALDGGYDLRHTAALYILEAKIVSVTQLRTASDIRYTDTGVIFPAVLEFDKWRVEAERLQQEHKSNLIWIGEIFVRGTDQFGERAASVVNSYCAETISRAMRVCRAIPAHRRKNVGFSMLQAIEKLPEADQDRLMTLCVKHDWTREAMREAANEVKARIAVEKAAAQPKLVTHTGARLPDEPAKGASNGAGSVSPPSDADIENLGDEEDETEDGRSSDDLIGDRDSVAGNVEVIPPDPLPEMAADDAVEMLRALIPTALPRNIGTAVLALLNERVVLLKVAKSAKIACELGTITPGLRGSVADLTPIQLNAVA